MRFFPKAKYLNAFRRGEIRMMSAYYYATLDLGKSAFYNNRHDSTEGFSYFFNNSDGGKVDLTINKCKLTIGEGVSKLCINSAEPNSQIKLSCCYYYLTKEKIPSGCFREELVNMGDDLGEYYCLFTNPKEYLLRVEGRLKRMMVSRQVKQYCSGLPIYKNIEAIKGFTNPFHKPDGLSWQNEYRIVVETWLAPDPFIVNIESISNISVCGKKSDLLQGEITGDDIISIPNVSSDYMYEPKSEND